MRHILLACAGAMLLAGCVNTRTARGVEPLWHQHEDSFVRGSSTRSEVLERLGPPSQVITTGEGSAYYYLLERNHARGMILLVYNDRRENTTYDRAVFFFDGDGVLTDFAMTGAQ